jgi:hypothetical protein
VQEQPDSLLLVDSDLDEVIARTKGSQLQAPVAGERPVVDVRSSLQIGDARLGGVGEFDVVLARRQRHRAFDRDAKCAQVSACNVSGRELGSHRDHAAADVDADGSRDDGTKGRNDRTDGRALAKVGVGHQREMRKHERHARRPLRLRKRLRLQHRGPADQSLAQLLTHRAHPSVIHWRR